MNSLTGSHRLFWPLVFPLGLALALTAQLVATNCGLGLTFDSYLYLDGATYFRSGTDGAMAEQPVFQAKPPFFSFLLSVVPLAAMPYLFTVLLGLNLFLLARIIKLSITSFFWQTITFLAIAAFTPLLMVHVYLWTEPVFLILLYALILGLISAKLGDSNKQFLVYASLLAVGMVLTRHVSIFFLAGIFIAMVSLPAFGWRKALIVLLPAVIIFIIWNFGFMADGLGERLTTFKAPVATGSWARLQNFEYYLEAASTWILPGSLAGFIRVPIFIVVIIIVFYFTRRIIGSSPVARILLIIAAVYYLLMHISFLIDQSSADRYLAPIYPLVLIAVFHLAERSTHLKHKLIKILVVFWLVYPVGRLIKNTIFWQAKICQEDRASTSVKLMENSQVNQE